MLAFLVVIKTVKKLASFVLRQLFGKGLLVEARPMAFRDFQKFFGLPVCLKFIR